MTGESPEGFIAAIDTHENAATTAEHVFGEAVRRVILNLEAIGDSKAASDIMDAHPEGDWTEADKSDTEQTVIVSEQRLLLAIDEAIQARRSAGLNRHEAAYARENLLKDL